VNTELNIEKILKEKLLEYISRWYMIILQYVLEQDG
jgi:hypothetical protein